MFKMQVVLNLAVDLDSHNDALRLLETDRK